MEIHRVTKDQSAICRQILEVLPDWFGLQDAREAYILAAQDQVMLVCRQDRQDVGMLTLARHSDWNLEIAVMGVLPSHHRQGVGKMLVQAADAFAAKAGVNLLSVKTLSDKNPNPHYKMTRDFYCAMGFELFEEFPTLWDKHNPCALYVRPVKTHA